MKVYAAFSPEEIRQVDLPVPEPDDYEVLVKNEGCVFCNTTDRMIVERLFAAKAYPVVFGHESFGHVVRAGARVRKFRPGDRVICANAIVCGFDGTYYSAWGGFAEYGIAGDLDAYLADGHMLDAANAYRGRYAANLIIPDDLPPEKAALAFPLAETASAALQVGDLTGKHVVVAGTGIAGYSLTYFCRAYGAASVTALGRRASRLAVSSALGADAVCTGTEALTERMKALGGADVVFEATGNYAVFEKGLPFLREGGILAVYAVPHRPYALDLRSSPRSFRYQRIDPRVPEALDNVCRLLREDKLPWQMLLTHTWGFDELPEAFEQVRAGEVIKGLVKMDSSI